MYLILSNHSPTSAAVFVHIKLFPWINLGFYVLNIWWPIGGFQMGDQSVDQSNFRDKEK